MNAKTKCNSYDGRYKERRGPKDVVKKLKRI